MTHVLPHAPATTDPVEPSIGAELDEFAGTLFAELAALPVGNHQRVRLREAIIEHGLPFAVRLARHYQGRGEPLEDLVQVATLGLIKAIDGYDIDRGPFSHYAGPTIRGEIKKHFRDRGWSIRVPRRLQELKMEMSRASQVLTHQLGRSPTVADLAGFLSVDAEQVAEGLDLAHAYQPVSLDAPVSPNQDAADLGAMLGESDRAVDGTDDRITLQALLPALPEREQRILAMRFSGNMTQSQIAAEIGISQMHVSRLLSATLAWLRDAMTAEVPQCWPGGVPAPAGDPGALRLSIERVEGGTVVVCVGGEVDHDNAGDLGATVCGRALADRPREVRVDLAAVPLIDAAGIAALVSGWRAARHGGARFWLERTRRPVAEVLRQSGLGFLEPLGRAPGRPVLAHG
jgi:RNA polymerase sigma-B factor